MTLDCEANSYIAFEQSEFDLDRNYSQPEETADNSNFVFLESENLPQLAKLGLKSQDYLKSDPVTSLMITRQFGEFLARQVAKRNGLDIQSINIQYDLLIALENARLIKGRIASYFHLIRYRGNDASHSDIGTYELALENLKHAHELAVWYCQTFGRNKDFYPPSFKQPNFNKPNLDRTYLPEYKEAIAQLESTIANYKSLDRDLTNLPNQIISLEKKKESLKNEIVQLKNRFKQGHNKQKNQHLVKKQQLIDSQRQLELEQIRIEMELSDLQGFEFDAEIRTLIADISQRKAIAKSKLDLVQKDLLMLKSSVDRIGQYSSSEKLSLQKIVDEHDKIDLRITTLLSSGYISDRLQEEKSKILLLLQNMESLMYKAAKENLALPSLSFSIVSDLDRYGLH